MRIEVRMYFPYNAPPISDDQLCTSNVWIDQLTSETPGDDHVGLHEEQERPQRDTSDTSHDDSGEKETCQSATVDNIRTTQLTSIEESLGHEQDTGTDESLEQLHGQVLFSCERRSHLPSR